MNHKLSPIEKFRPLWEGGKSVEQYNIKIGFKIRMFVVNQLTALSQNNPNLFGQSEKDQLTKMVMDLKQDKTTIPLEQQNCTLEEYQKFLSDFFAHVDHEDRHGTVTTKTTSKFRLMSSFIDVLSSWGPIDEEMIKCKKYCQYKAVDIYKALKKGEIPKRGGPKELINNEKENNNININNQNNNYIIEQNNHILTNNIVNQYNHISNNMEVQNITNKEYNKNKKYVEKSADVNRNKDLRKLNNKNQNVFITKNYNVNVKKLTPDHYNKNNINTNQNYQYGNEIIYKTNIINQNNQMQDKTNINNYITRNKNNYISVNNNQNNYIFHEEPKSDKNLKFIKNINQNVDKNFDPRLHHRQNLQKQRTIDDTQQTKYLNTKVQYVIILVYIHKYTKQLNNYLFF